jgi:glutamine synthetase
MSLIDAVTGDSAMADDSRPHGLSALGEAFAAGVLRHLPALLPFTAANPNSYRRIKPSMWSGAFRCWGVNNREAPLRLVGAPGRPETVNFELKAVDGTANPYLALAAIVTAGLCGIRGGYTLPAPVFGDPAGVDGQEPLPSSLEEALAALEADVEFRAALEGTLGSETLCRVYPIIKRNECVALSGLSLEEQAAQLWARF